jgi:aminoglycoside phosphotransferase (APT) family kinase protein
MQLVEGVDVDKVTSWFVANVAAVQPPLAFELIAGGRSNLTFRVTDAAGGIWVLRRPPLGQVLATAHDMGREHRIISALGPTDVPVAPAIGYCDDLEVNGAPFYVMGYVDGLVLRDLASADVLSVDDHRRTGESLIATLARIHAVDPDAVGLGDLGRKDGYIERQLKRWYRQFNQSKMRELPMIDEVHARLEASIPEQGAPAIVHGDYRLDNCMVSADDGEVIAVLDWELCTLGDPLADVGLLMVYWTDAGDPRTALPGSPTTAEGFPNRAQLLERYEQLTGRDLSGVDYYVAFGYWKLACILEGVYARYAGGAMGSGGTTGSELFATQVESLATMALQAIERVDAPTP